jgi:Cu(I)/Ag(I) efflux system membrane protein CusA/SilA
MITFFIFSALVILGGYIILYDTPVDALPDLSENQVVVMTRRPGQSPINVQDQITYPITVNMQ